MSRAADWLARTLVRPQLPLVAVEVRLRSVGVVRLAVERGRTGLGAAVAAELPEGTLDLSLTRPNLVQPEAFQAALRSALERAGALAAGGAVSLVLPDPVMRLALIDGSGLREGRRESDEMVRFRLLKALPFDVRSARLRWRLAGGQALVAVAPEEILGAYEDAVEALGFRPGLVEAASLALASALPEAGGDAAVLLVNWDPGYVSFLLVRHGELALVRTLPGESTSRAVAQQAAATLQFCREKLGCVEPIEVAVRSGEMPGDEALAVLRPVLAGLEPRLFEPWRPLGSAERGDAAQALAGAAACVLRRAA